MSDKNKILGKILTKIVNINQEQDSQKRLKTHLIHTNVDERGEPYGIAMNDGDIYLGNIIGIDLSRGDNDSSIENILRFGSLHCVKTYEEFYRLVEKLQTQIVTSSFKCHNREMYVYLLSVFESVAINHPRTKLHPIRESFFLKENRYIKLSPDGKYIDYYSLEDGKLPVRLFHFRIIATEHENRDFLRTPSFAAATCITLMNSILSVVV